MVQSRSKNIHTLHANTDKIFNYSINTTCELHTERQLIRIQDSVKAGKLQIQKNSCNTIQSIIAKKRLYTSVIATYLATYHILVPNELQNAQF